MSKYNVKSNSSSHVQEIEYMFHFNKDGSFDEDLVADRFITDFKSPDKVKQLLSVENFKIYTETFLFVEFKDEDFQTRTLDVVGDWILGFSEIDELILGFSCSRQLTEEQMDNCYKMIGDYLVTLQACIIPSGKIHTNTYSQTMTGTTYVRN